MKLVSLTRGYFAQVDDDDYEKINKAKWRAMPVKNNDLVYAGNQRGMMHRQIMQAPTGTIIDHIDGDGLNNQRSNLRFCTARQNFGNARKRKTKCSSTYKGVYARPGNTWKAECAGKYLGNFSTEVDAAIAYNKAAKTIYGEFAG
jgi:UDP:flavonoid glycosyltransferase YjiC (YdhE family)